MADSSAPKISSGLEGVYITESSVAKVDGVAGRLYYRGYSIDLLARNSDFEETVYLLLNGTLPNRKLLDSMAAQLAAERDLPGGVVGIIKEMTGKADPMDIVRTAVSALAAYDGEVADQSPEANMRKSIRIISRTSSIVAAIGRASSGREYVAPDRSMGHVENFLYMLNGSRPSQEQLDILRVMFIIHAEHSSNASTFGTMVAGSTLADLYSAITAGIAVLKGPLHGGADEAALRMMRAIGNPENTESYIDGALAGKQKIMGFGHRVYKTYDPRAKIIREYLVGLQSGQSQELRTLADIALRAEKMMVDRLGQSKGIWPNVDFFAGPVYLAAGIPLELFTPIFAASRTAGWCAHMLEYWKNNRLFRPLEYYTGATDLEYVPVDKRQ